MTQRILFQHIPAFLTMAAAPHIIFAGGGAQGQLFPGIAVAAHVAKVAPHARISFAGPGRCREKHCVHSAGYQYLTVPSQPLPRNPMQALRFVTDNIAGYCAAKWILREQQASLVVGLGGHTSTAVVRAAAERGTPFIMLEQNAVPSRTTRWLSRAARMVCVAFEETKPHLHVQAPVKVTGNPSRPAFEEKFARLQVRRADANSCSRPKRVIVLGGAAGARSLNEAMPSALRQVSDCLGGWQVVHQTGEGQLLETERRYRQAGVEALAVTYIDEIASVMFESDLVICRSGGTTLAELALAGVPAVLVPYAHSREDHQLANAKVYAASRACKLIDESSQLGSLDKALARELMTIMLDEGQRKAMAVNMRALARPHAAADIAATIHEAICESKGVAAA